MKKIIKIADGFFAVLLILIYSLIAFGTYYLPNSLTVCGNDDNILSSVFYVKSTSDESVASQSANKVGTKEENINLLGVIPVKAASVTKSNTKSVIVSGQCFGVKLYTDGVIVVGTRDVETADGTINPAKECGIEVGDIIISINKQKVYSSDEVEEIFNDNNGKDYNIIIKRDEKFKSFCLKPAYSSKEGRYKAGMWVRDSTAGIGTVTFYNKKTSTIAALGHPITDVDTGETMPILNGEAVKTKVTSVTKSTTSETGSLCCDFLNTSIGSLKENTKYGIYGNYNDNALDGAYSQYDIATPQEIEKGFAQIVTTVDENGPAVYSIDIIKITYNDKEKNMIIRITDKNLINKTGGIVQGMSGSPIIQNGKLVGAVTHVIVNNPTKGYAIFAQTMYNETT